jgi:hypothetical protein
VLDGDGPGARLPACGKTVWTPGAWQTVGCRVDRSFDVDGDKVADCMRVVADERSVGIWAWPSCSGAPIAVRIDRGGVEVPIDLPAAIGSPAWARAIAVALVGDEHTACEAGCAAPDPAMQWLLAATDERRYRPVWQDGEPVLPPVEAVVLDPIREHSPTAAKRDDLASGTTRELQLDLGGARILLLDPRGQLLREVASCDAYRVFAADSFVAVIAADTGKWSWVLVHGAGGPTPQAACAGPIVFVPHAHGVDGESLVAVRPDSGIWWDRTPDTTDWRAAVKSGVLPLQPTVTLRQLAALLASAPPAAKPCTATAPLWTLEPERGCEYAGRDDVTGDGTPDCWTASAAGTPETGPLAWAFGLQVSCEGEWYSDTIDVDGVFRISDPHTIRRGWIADQLVGKAARCLPAFAECKEPDGALRRLLDRYAHQSTGVATPLRWQPGTPQVPERAVVVVTREQPGLPGRTPPYLITFKPLSTEPLASRATCGNLELWSAPVGAAVVDVRAHRWAWLYVASEQQHYWERALPDAVGSARCSDELALLDLSGGDLAVVDMKTGKSTLLTAAERAVIDALPDPTLAFRKQLADAVR